MAPAGKEGGEGTSAERRGRALGKGRGSCHPEARGGRLLGLGGAPGERREGAPRALREAAVHREAAIKKATEMAEKRAQGDTEERRAEAVKKIWAAKKMARQQEEAEASKQKSVAMKKRAREENVVARPSGMPGSGLW